MLLGTVGIDPRIALVGLVVGILVGISGVGGGSLVTPLLVLVLGVKPAVAVGTDLLYSMPTRLLGAAVHHRQRTVDWRLVRYLVFGGVPGSLLGLLVLGFLQGHIGVDALNGTIKRVLGVMLILVSAAIVLKPLLARRGAKPAVADGLVWLRGTAWRVAALGALVGFLVSLTSVGSGSLTVPMLYMVVPALGLRRLVGSDVAFAAIITPVATLGHLEMGHVNVGLALSLIVGSLPGVVVGSKLCARVPDVWLRPVLAGALVFAGSRLI